MHNSFDSKTFSLQTINRTQIKRKSIDVKQTNSSFDGNSISNLIYFVFIRPTNRFVPPNSSTSRQFKWKTNKLTYF